GPLEISIPSLLLEKISKIDNPRETAAPPFIVFPLKRAVHSMWSPPRTHVRRLFICERRNLDVVTWRVRLRRTNPSGRSSQRNLRPTGAGSSPQTDDTNEMRGIAGSLRGLPSA